MRKGQRSVSSVSCGSLNHDETGTALLGWKMYDAGELSMMIVSEIGRPSCDKSYDVAISKAGYVGSENDLPSHSSPCGYSNSHGIVDD